MTRKDSAAPAAPPTESVNSSAKLTKKTLDELDLTKHRLAKLKLEEERLLGQIKLATHRSSSLNRRRELTHEVNEERRTRNEEIEKRQQEIRESVSASRRKRSEAMEISKQKLLSARRTAAEQIQRERKINECAFHIGIEEERKKTLSRRQQIRELESTLKERRDRAANNRLTSVRHQMRQEIEYDHKARDDKAQEAQRLKRSEEALRQKIEELKAQRDRSRHELEQLYGTPAGETPRPATSSTRSSPRKEEAAANDESKS